MAISIEWEGQLVGETSNGELTKGTENRCADGIQRRIQIWPHSRPSPGWRTG